MAHLMTDPPGFGIGWFERLLIPDPAVGLSWSHTVDGRYYERLIGVRWHFVASAVVANRYPMLTLRDADGAILLRSPVMQVIVAGNNSTMNSRFDGYSDFAQNQAEQFSDLPDLLIPSGWSWAGDVVGQDAGDQVSGVVLLVQRFPNDAAVIGAAG